MNNVTNPVDLFVGMGSLLGDNFFIGHMVLFTFFIIFLIMALRYDFEDVLIIDSFITALIGVLFFFAGFASFLGFTIPFIILVIALVFKLMR